MTATGWGRTARVLFSGHLALIAFSTLALTTILKGPPGPFLQQEPNATIMRLGWRFAGPAYVVLGALAALAHATAAVGGRRALQLFLAASGIALASELLGTGVGLPFGEYHYTSLLGYRILGLVPFPIPISWFYMLYGSLAICGRVLPADNRRRWRWAAVAGLVLLAWDISMDPAMVHTAHWVWGRGDAFRSAGLPAWVVSFFTRDAFYGMPLSNWLGWYLTGTVIARVMLQLVPPTEIAARVAGDRLPILIYAANGIMPVALCLRDGLWWAAALGAGAMLLPAVWALARVPALRPSSTAVEQAS